MPDGDVRQVMAKAHMTLWVRQAKKMCWGDDQDKNSSNVFLKTLRVKL
jgi:hypothetical protein